MPNPKNRIASTLSTSIIKRSYDLVQEIKEEAFDKYSQVRPDSQIAKDTPDRSAMGADAFRHAYASARLSHEFGSAVSSTVMRSWEMAAAASRENDSAGENAKDIGMDLHNNRVGRGIGEQLGKNDGPKEIIAAIERAADEGKLILSTNDPRAQAEYDKQLDMRGLSSLHDIGAAVVNKSNSLVEGLNKMLDHSGVEKPSDLLKQTPDKPSPEQQSFIDAVKDTMASNPDSPMFKFSDAQLADAAKFEKSMDPVLVQALANEIGVSKSWEMPEADFQKSTPTLVAARDAGLDQESAAKDPGLQRREQASVAERTRELEHEVSAEA